LRTCARLARGDGSKFEKKAACPQSPNLADEASGEMSRELDFRPIVFRGLDARQRTKALLLSAWFFVTVAGLWLLKAVRVASLLAHLGAVKTPYVPLAGVVTVGLVVMLYSAQSVVACRRRARDESPLRSNPDAVLDCDSRRWAVAGRAAAIRPGSLHPGRDLLRRADRRVLDLR
jgi:hypothetical protein